MSMATSVIKECVMEAIEELLPETTSVSLHDKADPIRHLGLDSFDGVACACSLSDKLKYQIPDAFNPFVDDEKQRSRCISEIVDALALLIAQKEENTDE